MEVLNGRVLFEVQVEAGDTGPKAGHSQEREARDARDVPYLRDEGVQDREGVVRAGWRCGVPATLVDYLTCVDIRRIPNAASSVVPCPCHQRVPVNNDGSPGYRREPSIAGPGCQLLRPVAAVVTFRGGGARILPRLVVPTEEPHIANVRRARRQFQFSEGTVLQETFHQVLERICGLHPAPG